MRIPFCSLFYFASLAFLAHAAFAVENPIFVSSRNQVMFHGGISVRSGGIEGFREVKSDGSRGNYKPDLGYASLTYSQPTDFFRMASRRNLELGVMAGRKHGGVERSDNSVATKNYAHYNQALLGVSQDALFGRSPLYLSLGLGAYIKSKATDRISSRFTFGGRAALGTNIGAVSLEAYARHFSNGSLNESNSGQNFIGISAGMRF